MTPSRKPSAKHPMRLFGAFVLTLVTVCLALPSRNPAPEALETRWLGAVIVLSIAFYVVMLAKPGGRE